MLLLDAHLQDSEDVRDRIRAPLLARIALLTEERDNARAERNGAREACLQLSEKNATLTAQLQADCA